MRTSFHHQSEAQPPNGPLTAAPSPDTPSICPARQSVSRNGVKVASGRSPDRSRVHPVPQSSQGSNSFPPAAIAALSNCMRCAARLKIEGACSSWKAGNGRKLVHRSTARIRNITRPRDFDGGDVLSLSMKTCRNRGRCRTHPYRSGGAQPGRHHRLFRRERLQLSDRIRRFESLASGLAAATLASCSAPQ